MSPLPIIIGIIALVIGVGYVVTSSPQTPDDSPAVNVATTESGAVTVPTTDGVAPDAPAPAEDTSSDAPAIAESITPAAAGTYAPYDADALAQSDAEHILLFFHATWCPSCRALDADITANADTIPPNVAIYKIDYDTATDLKRQYGVTTQHSIIEISATGEAESAITHPRTLAGVLETI